MTDHFCPISGMPLDDNGFCRVHGDNYDNYTTYLQENHTMTATTFNLHESQTFSDIMDARARAASQAMHAWAAAQSREDTDRVAHMTLDALTTYVNECKADGKPMDAAGAWLWTNTERDADGGFDTHVVLIDEGDNVVYDHDTYASTIYSLAHLTEIADYTDADEEYPMSINLDRVKQYVTDLIADKPIDERSYLVSWMINQECTRDAAHAAAEVWSTMFRRTVALPDDACVFEVTDTRGMTSTVDLADEDLDALLSDNASDLRA